MSGFKEDEIFLLSKEEYEKYKHLIPTIGDWWWLRSPGIYFYHAANVGRGGSVNNCGTKVDLGFNAVRPALKISTQESSNLNPGEEFEKYGNTWIYLGDNLAISRRRLQNVDLMGMIMIMN